MLFAQSAESPEACEGSWKSVAIKVPISTVALHLATTKDGLEQLQWPNPEKEPMVVQTHKVKGPPDSKGEVMGCTRGLVVVKAAEVLPLGDLKKVHTLAPGYYIVRVRYQTPSSASGRIEGSDFVVVQIK